MSQVIVNPCALPFVLVNHFNMPAKAIQTLMSAGNLFPHSNSARKRMRNETFLLQLGCGSKLYMPSTLNIDLILCHTQLILCAENVKSWVFHFTFQAYILPHTRDIHIECSKQFKWNLYFYVSGQSRLIWAALKLH